MGVVPLNQLLLQNKQTNQQNASVWKKVVWITLKVKFLQGIEIYQDEW